MKTVQDQLSARVWRELGGVESSIGWDLLPTLTLGVCVADREGSYLFSAYLGWLCTAHGEFTNDDAKTGTASCCKGCSTSLPHYSEVLDVDDDPSQAGAYELIVRALDAHGVNPLSSCLLADTVSSFIIRDWIPEVLKAQRTGASFDVAPSLAFGEIGYRFEEISLAIESAAGLVLA